MQMQDQKQHVIISIASLIVGNQIQDLQRPASGQSIEGLTPADTSPDQPEMTAPESVNSGLIATARKPRAKRGTSPLQAVFGKAIGTLFLALLVWWLFGRSKRE